MNPIGQQELAALCADAFLKGNQISTQKVKLIMTNSKCIKWLLPLITWDSNIYCCFCLLIRQSLLKETYEFVLQENQFKQNNGGKKQVHLLRYKQQCISIFMNKIAETILLMNKSQKDHQLFKLSLEAMGALVRCMVQTLVMTNQNFQEAIKNYLFPLIQSKNLNQKTNADQVIDFRIYVILNIINSCLVCLNNQTRSKCLKYKVTLQIFRKYVVPHFHSKLIDILNSNRQLVIMNIDYLEIIFKIADQIINLFKVDENIENNEQLEDFQHSNEVFVLPKWFLIQSQKYFQIFEVLFSASVKQEKITKSVNYLSTFLNLVKIWNQKIGFQQSIIDHQKNVLQFVARLVESRIKSKLKFNIESNTFSILFFVLNKYCFAAIRYLLSESFINSLFKYFELAMSSLPFKVLQGQGNPATCIFRIFKLIVDIYSSSDFKLMAKNLLKIFSSQIMDDDYDLKENFPNYKQQMELYKNCFKPIKPVFSINAQENINSIKNSIMTFGDKNKNMTIFCLMMIQNPDSNKDQCLLLLNMYEKMKENKNAGLSFLYALEIIIKTIMPEDSFAQIGQNTSYLWAIIYDRNCVQFQTFISEIIYFITQSFTYNHSYLIQYGLKILQYICNQILAIQSFCLDTKKKLEYENFKACTKPIEQFIKQNKLKSIKGDFHQRKKLYQIIALLWVENDINYVYQIYTVIKDPLIKNSSLISCLNYLVDCTGILKSIKKQHIYKVLVQLILTDFPIIQKFIFENGQKRAQIFSSTDHLKIYLQFICYILGDDDERITNQIHTDIPILLYDTFYNVINSIRKQLPFDEIQQLIMKVYLNLAILPLPNFEAFPLLELPQTLNLKKKYTYGVISTYFNQVFRISNSQLLKMYSYCYLSIDYFSEWAEQMINRDIQFPLNIETLTMYMVDRFPDKNDIIKYSKILHQIYRNASLKDYKLNENELIQLILKQSQKQQI